MGISLSTRNQWSNGTSLDGRVAERHETSLQRLIVPGSFDFYDAWTVNGGSDLATTDYVAEAQAMDTGGVDLGAENDTGIRGLVETTTKTVNENVVQQLGDNGKRKQDEEALNPLRPKPKIELAFFFDRPPWASPDPCAKNGLPVTGEDYTNPLECYYFWPSLSGYLGVTRSCDLIRYMLSPAFLDAFLLYDRIIPWALRHLEYKDLGSVCLTLINKHVSWLHRSPTLDTIDEIDSTTKENRYLVVAALVYWIVHEGPKLFELSESEWMIKVDETHAKAAQDYHKIDEVLDKPTTDCIPKWNAEGDQSSLEQYNRALNALMGLQHAYHTRAPIDASGKPLAPSQPEPRDWTVAVKWSAYIALASKEALIAAPEVWKPWGRRDPRTYGVETRGFYFHNWKLVRELQHEFGRRYSPAETE